MFLKAESGLRREPRAPLRNAGQRIDGASSSAAAAGGGTKEDPSA